MKNIRFLSRCFLFISGLLLQPHWLWADSAETVIKVEKGDIVWSQEDATSQQIYYSSCQNGKSAWSSPVNITNDSYRNGHPVIDADSSDKKWLVWTAGTGTDYMIRYAVGKDDTWSEPAAIPSQLKENLAPSVVVDTADVTWVVWSANDGGQDEIYFSKYSGGIWTTPMQVNSGNEVPDILPQIALDADGNPQVTWRGYRNGAYVQLQSTWNGEAWSDEKEILESSQKTAAEAIGSIVNMPSFIEQPEKAFLRVYKSSTVK